jgi:YhcH/YjgK/YiaL family protein
VLPASSGWILGIGWFSSDLGGFRPAAKSLQSQLGRSMLPPRFSTRMIYGKLHDLNNYSLLLTQPTWKRAFEWIQAMPAEPECRIHQLDGDRLFVNVMRYGTVPPEQSRFESHRRYVDLQYTIAGAEQIEVRHASELKPDGAYDPETDLQFYQAPVSAPAKVDKQPGWFSIFFPEDAHRPKISDGKHDAVYKLVVKIDVSLLA